MGRPTQENSLSQQDVVRAAIACIDQGGATALGVSQVARALGIRLMLDALFAAIDHIRNNPADC
ncbi:MAG: hypothetical protein AAF215_11800 [Cyanobacteria bacterium P01_A01_bin.123]